MNMNRIMYFLLFCSVGLISTSLLAQNTGGNDGGNNDGNNDDEIPTITVNESGTGVDTCKMFRTVITVHTANLVLAANGTDYEFPSNTEDMYLRTSFNGDETTVLLQDWSQSVVYGSTSNPIFSTTVYFSHNYKEECNSSAPLQTVEVIHELLALDKLGNYIPYPVCDYNDPGEIFSCLVFNNIPCALDNEPCESSDFNYNSYDYELDCLCSTSGEGSGFNINPHNNSSLLAPEFEVVSTTNPFTEHLNINWTNTSEQLLTFRLISTTGQVLGVKQTSDQYGTFNFDSSTLPPGIYLLHTSGDNEQNVLKLIKQ